MEILIDNPEPISCFSTIEKNKKKMPLILIVDDVHANIQVMGKMLQSEGYKLAFATTGSQAIDTALKIIPDLILLDVVIPAPNGFEVCRTLKNHPKTNEIPIIFLTAYRREPEYVVKGFEMGAADFVTKPFNSAELKARVKTHLDLKQRTEELRKNQKILKISHDELEKRVKDRTKDLEELNKKLIAENEERIRTEKELLVYQEKLRSMTAELSLIEEKERRRIAIDVHDSIGQTLALVKIALGSLRRSISSSCSPGGYEKEVGEIIGYVEKSIKEIRSLTYELSPPILYELGLGAAIRNYLENMQEKYDFEIKFTSSDIPGDLNNTMRILLFRSVQELIVNIIKHADAKHINVLLEKNKDHIEIIVEDDGCGFDDSVITKTGTRGGLGLFSIRERLMHLGGKFEINSFIGKGTQVFLSAPVVLKNNK